jgi:hypothetical protein
VSTPALDGLLRTLRTLGAQRVLCKRLAENDNSKQQVYFGHGFDALNLVPFGEVTSDSSTKQPIMKAALALRWLDDEGRTAPAPGAQLVLYPQYPEVRMSGFLRGCPVAPAALMRPVPKEQRRFNNGPDGRLLFLALLPSREIVAYLAPSGSEIAGDLDARQRQRPYRSVGVFLDVPLVPAGEQLALLNWLTPETVASGVALELPLVRLQQSDPKGPPSTPAATVTGAAEVALPELDDPRALLIARLRQIHAAGWHQSCRLHADGTLHPYTAINGGGYTLEALFGIVPNGKAEPDVFGWELKACGSDRVTLMTPEPNAGYYGHEGVEAFVRQYGHVADGDTLYFTGIHRSGAVCDKTKQTLSVRGFDASSGKITDVDGGIYLVANGGEDSAGWSFSGLLEHWGRKHAAAAYVPYERGDTGGPAYRYTSPVMLGEGTRFEKFLAALAAGTVYYDPGSKVEEANSMRPRVKARSQFRVGRKNLAQLYDRFTAEPIDQDPS